MLEKKKMMDTAPPAVANVTSATSESGISNVTESSVHRASVKKVTTKTEERLSAPITKVKVDTSKMKTLCEELETTLVKMVDDTREDDLFIQRLQEEFLKEDEKWDEKVTVIKNEFLDTKKEMFKDQHTKEMADLNVTIASLRDDLKASEKSNHDLKFELEQKGNEIGRLGEEIEKMKNKMNEEGQWRDKIQNQLEDIQQVKEETNKERLNSMSKVSDEIIKYRNKRVPATGDLDELHHLVDSIHHSMGYLMVLGNQLPVTSDRVLPSTPKETMKKKKVSMKSKKETKVTVKGEDAAAAEEESLTNGRDNTSV